MDPDEVDLMTLLLARNPYQLYAQLRERRPVCRGRYLDGSPVWLVSRYADVTAALTDPRLVHDLAQHHRAATDLASGLPPDIEPYFTRSMLDRDPPDHTRLRRLVSRGFTARRVRRLEPRIQQITDDLLAGIAARRAVDLIEEFAYPLPMAVIGELLGVPPAERAEWRDWTADLFGVTPGRLADSARSLLDHVFGLIQRRRAEPADDLISDLVGAHDAGDRLSEEELASMVIGLIAAGHETTVQLIGNGVYALLMHPDQLRLLRTDPALLPVAVDELLRFLGPAEVAGVRRMAVSDMSIGGVPISAGELVLPLLGAANHDPRRFTDPARLDLTRASTAHLGFGHGIHFCLGAALARTEGRIAIGSLLRRFPHVELDAAPEDLPWRNSGVRGLARLPVRLQTPSH